MSAARVASVLLAVGLSLACLVDCGSSTTRDFAAGSPDAAPDAATGAFPEAGAPCTGLRCDVPTCAAGATTAIEGDVYDPGGKLKLYGAIVYVPNAPLAPLATGATCDRCGTVSGEPIATALSDANGHFRIEGVPAGKDVPLVIQIGKWRRKIVVKSVEACATTLVPDREAHLPTDQTEGDLPQIAIVTAASTSSDAYCPVWASAARVHRARRQGPHPRLSRRQRRGPDERRRAQRADPLGQRRDAREVRHAASRVRGLGVRRGRRNQREQDGRRQAAHARLRRERRSHLRDALPLHLVQAEPPGRLPRGRDVERACVRLRAQDAEGRHLVPEGRGVLEVAGPGRRVADGGHRRGRQPGEQRRERQSRDGQRWLYTDEPNVAYMSFNVPVGAAAGEQCGRAVFTDIHVGGEQGSRDLPGACGAAKLTPQETALEFLMFDLAACVQPDSQAPTAPPVR